MHDRKSFCNRLINQLFCFGICLLAKRRHGKYFFERRAPFHGSQDKPVRFQFSQYSAEITAVHYIILANIAGDHTGIPHDGAKYVHFMKSIRGSDPDAALHYLARFLEAGDLPSACRRILCSACEDIGLAYPQAIAIVKACVDSALQLGMAKYVFNSLWKDGLISDDELNTLLMAAVENYRPLIGGLEVNSIAREKGYTG